MKNRKREICTSGSVRDEDGEPPHLLGRRQFLGLAAVAAALPAVSRIAGAQAYPSRPVRWLVDSRPAGGTDITARLIGPWLTERLGQPFVIENRPGAGTNIAPEAVMRASPDGYTLFLTNFVKRDECDPLRQAQFRFSPRHRAVAGIIRRPFVMVVNPSLPVKTVAEFIAYAKANPGKISFGFGRHRQPGHLAGELFKMMAEVELTHVPYRGGGAGADRLDRRTGAALFPCTA